MSAGLREEGVGMEYRSTSKAAYSIRLYLAVMALINSLARWIQSTALAPVVFYTTHVALHLSGTTYYTLQPANNLHIVPGLGYESTGWKQSLPLNFRMSMAQSYLLNI